jgi:hypothetical protein
VVVRGGVIKLKVIYLIGAHTPWWVDGLVVRREDEVAAIFETDIVYGDDSGSLPGAGCFEIRLDNGGYVLEI